MSRSFRTSLLFILVAAAVVAMLLLLQYWQSPSFYQKQQRRMVERVINSDPHALLLAGRDFLRNRTGYLGEVDTSSSEIPKVIRELRPTNITFSTNEVWIDFSDAFNPFGIVVFSPGFDGPAPHKWIDGLWLFDDGQLHRSNYLERIGQQIDGPNGDR